MNLEPSVTAWIVILGLAALYEGAALIIGWRTLSQRVWVASKRWPFVPFAAGFLMGHFFA